MMFGVMALPLLLATGRRIARRDGETGFGTLLEELRAQKKCPLPGWLARPRELAAAVERWLPILPPRRYGRCLRRALLLSELWARCGLEPKLHLGFRADSPVLDGHAWLTACTADGAVLRVSDAQGSAPAFEL